MQPAPRSVCTASSISARLAMPVEAITGLPVAPILRSSGMSTSSKLATLCAGASRDSRKSTAEASKGVEKTGRSRSAPAAMSPGVHSQGMAASRYRSYRVRPSQRVPLMRKQSLSASMVRVSAV